MKCIIIDDDSVTHKILRSYILKRPELRLIGEFEGVESALPLIAEEEVELIFLDVVMPKMTGIDFMASFIQLPQIIIVSAHKEYAVEGFTHNVTDYLTKPITYERFGLAIDKVFERRVFEKVKRDQYKSIAVKQRSGYINIATEDILYIEGFGDYVNVVLTLGKKVTILSTIKAMEEQLAEFDFMRIHRSYIVHLKKIDKIIDHEVYIDDHKIPVSRTYRSALTQLFKRDAGK